MDCSFQLHNVRLKSASMSAMEKIVPSLREIVEPQDLLYDAFLSAVWRGVEKRAYEMSLNDPVKDERHALRIFYAAMVKLLTEMGDQLLAVFRRVRTKADEWKAKREQDAETAACPVCQETFARRAEVVILPCCRNQMHVECAMSDMMTSKTCALCRKLR